MHCLQSGLQQYQHGRHVLSTSQAMFQQGLEKGHAVRTKRHRREHTSFASQTAWPGVWCLVRRVTPNIVLPVYLTTAEIGDNLQGYLTCKQTHHARTLRFEGFTGGWTFSYGRGSPVRLSADG